MKSIESEKEKALMQIENEKKFYRSLVDQAKRDYSYYTQHQSFDTSKINENVDWNVESFNFIKNKYIIKENQLDLLKNKYPKLGIYIK